MLTHAYSIPTDSALAAAICIILGTMNSMVYPVHGGMEDWMYAAGWDDSAPIRQCIGLNGGKRALSALSSISDMKQRLNMSPASLPDTTSLSLPAPSRRLVTESQPNTTTESPLQQEQSESSEVGTTKTSTNHTIFDNHNRAIVFLVETSDDKRPKDEDLGTTHEVE